MSKLQSPDIGWPERLAIMDHYELDDDTAATAFGVTQDEVSTAKELKDAGTIILADGIDFSLYRDDLTIKTPKAIEKAKSTAPVTATKPAKESKKRGRKGSKIVNAFKAVPSTPVTVSAFTAEHQVSVPVLRQWKRFDKTGLKGQVRVKKDKASGELMIWRDNAE